jgi:hypothetical protein
MIQQTQAEWYAKFKASLPLWFWQKEVVVKAYMMALAKVASDAGAMADASFADTFITSAKNRTLDAHGDERDVTRLDSEVDPDYALRVQRLLNQSNIPDLCAFIDKFLVAGTSRIEEDYNSVPFCDRSFFANRAALFLSTPLHNTFSVVVDRQRHAPFSYADREYFCDRGEAFAGSAVSENRVFEAIRQIVDDNKAFGTLYRIFELLE